MTAKWGKWGVWPLVCYALLVGLSLPSYIGLARSWHVDTAPAVDLMDASGLRGGFSNYWAANLITLETRERLVVAQFTGVPLRHRAYYDLLSRTDQVGYLFNRTRFLEDRRMLGGITRALEAEGIDYNVRTKGEWELVIPLNGSLPLKTINEFRLAPGREEIRRKLKELNERAASRSNQRSLRKVSRTAR
jgi:hypothetical protein